MKKRIEYLDIAKAILIILMICGHCDNFKNIDVSHFVNLFHMNCFIFISGFLFNGRTPKSLNELFSYSLQKIKKLYIFYIIWEIIFLIFNNFFLDIGFYNSTLSYGGKFIAPITTISVFLKKIFGIIFLIGREPFAGAFWYLISYIFVIIGYFTIKYISDKFKKNNLAELCLIIVSFILGCIMSFKFNIPRVSPSLTFILFFYLGIKYKENANKITFQNGILFIIMLLILVTLNNFGSVDMNHNSFTNPLYLIISFVCGIYVVMFLSIHIEKKSKIVKNIFLTIGRNTLPILALHLLCFKVVMCFQYLFSNINLNELGYLNGYNNSNILLYLLYVVVGIFLPIFIYKILNFILKKCLIKRSLSYE